MFVILLPAIYTLEKKCNISVLHIYDSVDYIILGHRLFAGSKGQMSGQNLSWTDACQNKYMC